MYCLNNRIILYTFYNIFGCMLQVNAAYEKTIAMYMALKPAVANEYVVSSSMLSQIFFKVPTSFDVAGGNGC